MPLPNFSLVMRSYSGSRQKYFLRRSHKVALVGGVNSAQMPLLIMIVSCLTLKPYLGNCVVFI